MTIKFNMHAVVNGTTGVKARVWYSAGVLRGLGGVEQACVTLYSKDYGHELSRVFDGVDIGYENDTDTMTDYFAKGRVRIPAGHALYDAALARAEANEAKRAAKYA